MKSNIVINCRLGSACAGRSETTLYANVPFSHEKTKTNKQKSKKRKEKKKKKPIYSVKKTSTARG